MNPGSITKWVKLITKRLNIFANTVILTSTALLLLGMLLGLELPKGAATLLAISYATILVLKLRKYL